ncbi:MAG: hypothetical protein ACK5Z2_15220 [Bacteroidota bacterium]|jgi:hypothetical protein
MREFKVVFPSGFVIDNSINDNIDAYIALSNDKVYTITFFTINNIELLMKGSNNFWASDMVILRYLTKEIIIECIESLLQNDYFENAASYVGTIADILVPISKYDDLPDFNESIRLC